MPVRQNCSNPNHDLQIENLNLKYPDASACVEEKCIPYLSDSAY